MTSDNFVSRAPWPPKTEIDFGEWVEYDSFELVRLFQEGNKQERAFAFSTIYNRYSQVIWRYIYTEVNGVEAEAKDIFGQVWLVATEQLCMFERRENTRSTDPLRSWLFRCASNRIKKYHREKNAYIPLDIVENFLIDRLNGKDIAEYELFVPEVKSRATKLIVAATSKLNDDEKLILWLRYNRNMIFSEIGAYLGKKETTVKVQHFRLLKKLRAICEELACEEVLFDE